MMRSDRSSIPMKVWAGVALVAIALAMLPFVAALAGQAWVRILNFAMIYTMLALGLNIVVGFAGSPRPGLHSVLRGRRLHLCAAGVAAIRASICRSG